MTIHEKLSKIQQEFKAKKSRFNSFGKYNFRSAEDILEGLKPFNEKYNVYFTVSEKIVSDFYGNEKLPPILKSVATIHDAEGGMKISSTAIVGVDLNQKGMQVPQQFGSASSYGKKYALGNLLLIDDTADADATNTHGRDQKKDKPVLKSGTDAFTKAIEYIKSGGSITAINAKYKVDTAAKAELKKYEQA